MLKKLVIPIALLLVCAAFLAWTPIEQYILKKVIADLTANYGIKEVKYGTIERISFGRYKIINLNLTSTYQLQAPSAEVALRLHGFNPLYITDISIDQPLLVIDSAYPITLPQPDASSNTTLRIQQGKLLLSAGPELLKFDLQKQLDGAYESRITFQQAPLELLPALLQANYLIPQGKLTGYVHLKGDPKAIVIHAADLQTDAVALSQDTSFLHLSPVNLSFSQNQLNINPVQLSLNEYSGTVFCQNNVCQINLDGPLQIEASGILAAVCQYSACSLQINQGRAKLYNSAVAIDLAAFSGEVSLQQKGLQANFSVKQSSVKDHAHNLLVEEISGIVFCRNKEILGLGLEAQVANLLVSGGFSLTDSALKITCESVLGKFSDLKQALPGMQLSGLLQIPFDGQLSLKEELQIAYALKQGKKDPAIQLHGKFSEGFLTTNLPNVAIEELKADFTYIYPEKKFYLENATGVIIAGMQDSIEEYALNSDLIEFPNQENPEGVFDIWLGDRRRDVLRLVGKMQAMDNHLIKISFNPLLTHFGVMHPESCDLTVANWCKVEAFHLACNLGLKSMLHDLKRLARTGFYPLPHQLYTLIQNSQEGNGQFGLSLDYSRPEQMFAFDLQGHEIQLDQFTFNSGRIQGKVEDNIATLDRLQIDDLIVSADLVFAENRIKVPFCGVKFGRSLQAGIKGIFYNGTKTFHGKLQLAEWQPEINGKHEKLTAAGDFLLHFFKKPHALMAEGKLDIHSDKLHISEIEFQSNFKELQLLKTFYIGEEVSQAALRANLPHCTQGMVHLNCKDFQQQLLWSRNNSSFHIYNLDRSFEASTIVQSDSIAIPHLSFKNGQGSLQLKDALLEKTASWKLVLPALEAHGLTCKELFPFLKGSIQETKIAKLELSGVEFDPSQPDSFKGNGLLEFSGAQRRKKAAAKETFNTLGLSNQALLPSSGTLYFNLEQGKCVISKIRDLQSENKMIKYFLPKQPLSYVDSQGRLFVTIGLQPYNVIFKMTDLLQLRITGTIMHPQLSFVSQKSDDAKKN